MSEFRSMDELIGEKRARYAKLLTTAEWRVFAWRAKERAGFQCAFCSTRGERASLEVHHWWYDWARMPWDVEPGQVVVACAECHAEMERQWSALRATVEGRWVPGRVGSGQFLKLVQRHLCAGFTPSSLGQFNARLALGDAEAVGPLAAQVIRNLQKIER